MRIYEAVVASSAETLDGQQGFGLVRCSKSLPAELRREARNLGYSDDAGELPIYAFKRMDVDGKTWLLLNRAVHTVDYTGRASHVSHTIAFLEDEWRRLMESAPRVPSPFDFIRKFAWVSEWGPDRAKEWIEDGQDQDLTELERFLDTPPVTGPNDVATLLAFEYPQDSPPLPRKILWKCDSSDPNAILDLFHEAWTGLDPWQGERPYGDLLGEPPISIRDSWRCSFTTNLRHGRPDPFLWIASSPDCTSLQGREVLDLAKWKLEGADSIKQAIGARWGDQLVERGKSPRDWARKSLEAEVQERREMYQHKVVSENPMLEERAEEIIREIQTRLHEQEKSLREYEESGSKTFDEEEFLIGSLSKLKDIEEQARRHTEDARREFENQIRPILQLLGYSDIEATNEFQSIDSPRAACFSAFFIKLRDHSDHYKEVRAKVNLLEKWHRTSQGYEEEKKLRGSLEEKLELVQRDFDKQKEELEAKGKRINELSSDLAGLKYRASSPRKTFDLYDWRNVTLIALVVLLAGLLAWTLISRSAPPNSTASSTTEELARRNETLKEEANTKDQLIKEKDLRIMELENQNRPLRGTKDMVGSARDGGIQPNSQTARNPNTGGQAESQQPNQEASPSERPNAANPRAGRREVESSDKPSDQTQETGTPPEQSPPKQDEAGEGPGTNEAPSKTAVKTRLPAEPKTSGTHKPTPPK